MKPHNKYRPSPRQQTSEYQAWANMKRRCQNPNNPGYKNYGARGIKVCERWQSYDNFLADMGPKLQPDLTLERLDNDKGYEPGNCVWVNWGMNCANKRTTHKLVLNGETMCAKEWCKKLGLKYSTYLYRRKHYGWSPLKCLMTPAVTGVHHS